MILTLTIHPSTDFVVADYESSISFSKFLDDINIITLLSSHFRFNILKFRKTNRRFVITLYYTPNLYFLVINIFTSVSGHLGFAI